MKKVWLLSTSQVKKTLTFTDKIQIGSGGGTEGYSPVWIKAKIEREDYEKTAAVITLRRNSFVDVDTCCHSVSAGRIIVIINPVIGPTLSLGSSNNNQT